MRFLTTIGLIRKVRVPGDRITYYRIEDDAWLKVVQRKLETLGAFNDIAAEGLKLADGRVPRTERVRAAQRALTWLWDIAARNPPKT
jgi:DNA-binding transcriptional regulator GbsR (MarR family)